LAARPESTPAGMKKKLTTAAIFTRISLAVNIAVLIPVCFVLVAFATSEFVTAVIGPLTASRGILLSIYFAILINSVILIWFHVRCSDKSAIEQMVVALLATQILYKITTPATVGVSNPIVLCNLAVSALHTYTLALLWRQYKKGQRAM
jgi:hypothetical protein